MRFPPFATMFGLLLALSAVFGYVRPKEGRPGLGIYPEVAPLTAAPEMIQAGDPVTLSWNSRGAVSVVLESIPEGRTEAAEALRGLPPAGKVTVHPNETTVYRMKCETVFATEECAGLQTTVSVKEHKQAAPQVIESGFGGN